MPVQGKQQDQKLILEIDGKELAVLEEVMGKFSFKDCQSLIRFALSMLVLNETKVFSITIEGFPRDITPAAHLLKGENYYARRF